MPNDPKFLTPRRIATDQLVMSLGMSGDLKDSRAVAEMAIASDPDYPINYYNLACADAEQGDVTDAKLHLQQAFERRANVLKSEAMPDPTKDDSILKLKKDKVFWTFVLALPRN
jgi:tetratricopeptide (TPR) repeat protein